MADDRVAQILAAAEAAAEQHEGRLPLLLCLACAAALPVNGVGLALFSDRGHEGLVAASDRLASAMEDLQFGLGEGPCVDASTAGSPVLQPDLARTGPGRWPAFGPAALQAGIAAVFAFPLQVGGIRLGVLDLYRDSPGMLTPDQLAEGVSFADAATVVLMELQARQPADGELHPDLIDASHDLAEVHQATGMVAVQAAVSLAEALLLLRARAWSTDRSILDVALDVLGRRYRFHPRSPHDE